VLTVETVATIVRDVVALVVDLIQGDWSGAWENFKQIVQTGVDFVRGSIDNYLTFLQGLGSLFFNAAKNIGENLAQGLMGAIQDGVTLAGNAVIGILNRIIGAINSVSIPAINVPDWVPGIGGKGWGGWSPNIPEIPALALGGIVTGPTLALIGEQGHEAVVPLDDFRSLVTTLDALGTDMRWSATKNAAVFSDFAAEAGEWGDPKNQAKSGPQMVTFASGERKALDEIDDKLEGVHKAIDKLTEEARAGQDGAAEMLVAMYAVRGELIAQREAILEGIAADRAAMEDAWGSKRTAANPGSPSVPHRALDEAELEQIEYLAKSMGANYRLTGNLSQAELQAQLAQVANDQRLSASVRDAVRTALLGRLDAIPIDQFSTGDPMTDYWARVNAASRASYGNDDGFRSPQDIIGDETRLGLWESLRNGGLAKLELHVHGSVIASEEELVERVYKGLRRRFAEG
jgi:hypothetical protein